MVVSSLPLEPEISLVSSLEEILKLRRPFFVHFAFSAESRLFSKMVLEELLSEKERIDSHNSGTKKALKCLGFSGTSVLGFAGIYLFIVWCEEGSLWYIPNFQSLKLLSSCSGLGSITVEGIECTFKNSKLKIPFPPATEIIPPSFKASNLNVFINHSLNCRNLPALFTCCRYFFRGTTGRHCLGGCKNLHVSPSLQAPFFHQCLHVPFGSSHGALNSVFISYQHNL
mmetsp:Transcript_6319/g.7970  ORF Transcript_6319/g.7970 Transcript_6319/m.7970 type:complete len:227 (+) Transcript_6319:1273-1953(+)